jgi:hypothetical protein
VSNKSSVGEKLLRAAAVTVTSAQLRFGAPANTRAPDPLRSRRLWQPSRR